MKGLVKGFRLQALALGAAIFAAGALAGGGFSHMRVVRQLEAWSTLPPQQARHQLLVWALARQLDLDDGQRQTFTQILAGQGDGELLRAVEPRVSAARARARARMRAALRPEQQERFDAIAAEREARYRQLLEAPARR